MCGLDLVWCGRKRSRSADVESTAGTRSFHQPHTDRGRPATTLTPAFALLAILLSVLLGGLHAFAPGHGKTLMAAYLVGREGTWRQAAVIGVSVTVTHTIGVLLLGIALSAAALAAPEQVYPWLGLISGILLAGIGVTLMRSARNNHLARGAWAYPWPRWTHPWPWSAHPWSPHSPSRW